jgi:hypothetical protein
MGRMPIRGLRVISTGRVNPDPQWQMASHSHDHHELVVVLRGVMHGSGLGLGANCRSTLAELLAGPSRRTDALVEQTRADATGRTPIEDLRAIRIDHARTLVLGTNLTLKDTAPFAGLGNEYSRSRSFRRAPGSSFRSLRRFHERRSRTTSARR